jgi:hypothetical protein
VARQPEEVWAQLPEDHLVLVVHGIGQYYFAGTDDSFGSCIAAMRRNLMEQRCALDVEDAAAAAKASTTMKGVNGKEGISKEGEGQEEEEEGNPNHHKRIECLGVEWFNEVHDDSSIGMHEGLAKVTLPSVLSIRRLAHQVTMDVMLFLTPEFKQKILRIVVEKINLMFLQYCELNPAFVQSGAKCSLVGHSLGTVIVYDILAMQAERDLPPHLKLAFDPAAYFALGSPLGMFLTLRNSAARVHNCTLAREQEQGGGGAAGPGAPLDDDILNAAYSFPTCKQFFNVFNKNDPVAYRVEPMADASLQHKDPLIVPHFDGGLRAQYMLKSVATSISETWRSFASPSGWFKSATSTSSSSSSTLLQGASLAAAGSSPPSPPPSHMALPGPEGESELSLLQREAAKQRRLKICPPNEIPLVRLNGGRRFDFLLQESALEVANEYLSSLTSHTSYFEQKDVARFIAAMLI